MSPLILSAYDSKLDEQVYDDDDLIMQQRWRAEDLAAKLRYDAIQKRYDAEDLASLQRYEASRALILSLFGTPQDVYESDVNVVDKHETMRDVKHADFAFSAIVYDMPDDMIVVNDYEIITAVIHEDPVIDYNCAIEFQVMCYSDAHMFNDYVFNDYVFNDYVFNGNVMMEDISIVNRLKISTNPSLRSFVDDDIGIIVYLVSIVDNRAVRSRVYDDHVIDDRFVIVFHVDIESNLVLREIVCDDYVIENAIYLLSLYSINVLVSVEPKLIKKVAHLFDNDFSALLDEYCVHVLYVNNLKDLVVFVYVSGFIIFNYFELNSLIVRSVHFMRFVTYKHRVRYKNVKFGSKW